MTKQRTTILQVIQASTEHLTADEIYAQARKIMPSLSLGTVYRNLKQLTDGGVIRKILMPEASDRYDRNMRWHDHLCCEKCGQLIDANLMNLQPLLSEKLGQAVSSYSLTIYYVCPACKLKQKEQ